MGIPTTARRRSGRLLATTAGVALIAALCGALIFLIHMLTDTRIDEIRRQASLATLHQLLPPDAYTNDLFADRIQIEAPGMLGTSAPLTLYRAYRDGTPVAVLFPVVAPDGYNGPIHLLVGIRYDGTLLGVRVLQEQETPGLGDRIEQSKSDWITAFAGRSLDNPAPDNWAVKRDGGAFDELTGATITPRAVVRAVKDALLYFHAHRDEWFPQSASGNVQHD